MSVRARSWAAVHWAGLHLCLFWGFISALCTWNWDRSEVFSHTWIPPGDRLLHAVVMPVVAVCSGTVGVGSHQIFLELLVLLSWQSPAANAGWQTQVFPAAGPYGKSALLPNSCLSSPGAWERGLILWWRVAQTGGRLAKKKDVGRGGLSCFFSCVRFPRLFHRWSKSSSTFSWFWNRARFNSSFVVVFLEMGWTGHAREPIHYRVVFFF